MAAMNICLLFVPLALAVSAPDASLEVVSTGHRFTEGPAADPDGNVYFSDVPQNLIHRIDAATGEVTVAHRETGGANGLIFDAQGRVYACAGKDRVLARHDADGRRATLADAFEGDRLNSPNDIVLAPGGGLYFTDPRYGKRNDMAMTVEGVYHRSAAGKLSRVIDDLVRPNGITLAPDGRTLYVADNAAKVIVAYDVADDGSLSGKRPFAAMDKADRNGPDGMTIDTDGNVYAAGQGGIWVWKPTGELIEKIAVPKEPANVAFGGAARDTLYITARDTVYRIRTTQHGLPPAK